MRSGDIHKDNQHDFVFSGLVEVLTLRNDGTTEKKIYQENQYICIPPYTPHVFHFTRDTVLAQNGGTVLFMRGFINHTEHS